MTKGSSIDSRGVVGDLGEEVARNARLLAIEVVPAYLHTAIRDSISGRRAVAACSVSGFSSTIAKQSPKAFPESSKPEGLLYGLYFLCVLGLGVVGIRTRTNSRWSRGVRVVRNGA